LNDCFTQVLEMARELGMGKLGKVAIDSTRIKASASRDKLDTEQHLRDLRAGLRRQVRRWQQMMDADDADSGGLEVAIDHLESRLAALPQRLERLRKSGMKKLSQSDPDARFLRTRSGFELGYTAEIAVSDDHLIVAQRVTRNATDNASLLPMVDQVRERCGQPPGQTLADSGFFSIANLEQMEEQNLDACVPDSNLARSLNLGVRCRQKACAPAHRRMRRKLQTDDGRLIYGRRKAIVEPVFGVLKQQRNMRQFRTRGIQNVGNEWTLAAMAYNLTRIHAAAVK
jgi:hypothetical protein